MKAVVACAVIAVVALGCQPKGDGDKASGREEGATSTKRADEAEQAGAEPDEAHFAGELFGGYVDCYTKLEINGAVDGRLEGVVTSEGRVENVSYSGSAPKPAVHCMVEAAKAVTLKGYNGEKGVAYLSWSGTLQGGVQMLSQEWDYRRFSDLSPEDRAAYEAPAGDAPAEPAAPEGPTRVGAAPAAGAATSPSDTAP